MGTGRKFGGHTMVAPLRRVALHSPRAAGWFNRARVGGWKKLGYLHKPNAAAAQAQHDQLHSALMRFGAEVIELGAGSGLSPDSVYVHDASLVTNFGAICLRMGKPQRMAEPEHHAKFYRALGVPLLRHIRAPGTVEAGDIVWLDPATLLVGRGYRTNSIGIAQLRALLAPKGVDVFQAPLPHELGPCNCLHLMSLISLLDESTALVDLPRLAVETVEMLREWGYRLVEIDLSERDTLACNVLALGNGALLSFRENRKTNQRLRRMGFEVITIPGSEIGINGGGGPTCLTRPLLRR